MPTYKVELQVSKTHTYTVEDRDGPDWAAGQAARSYLDHGEPGDEVGWPDVEVNQITAVDDEGNEGLSMRVLRIYATSGWLYYATNDATNEDLAKGPDRDAVICQGWSKLTEPAEVEASP